MATTADRTSGPNANRGLYASVDARKYVNAAPHLKPRRLLEFHVSLIGSVYSAAARNSEEVRVLDLGAGEGSCTYRFLQLGARVTAVNVSEHVTRNEVDQTAICSLFGVERLRAGIDSLLFNAKRDVSEFGIST